MRRVGIIGLGDMGMGMARNIIKGGFPLVGYDLRDIRLKELEEAGGVRAATCREVGESSDAVFVMVLNGDQVKEAVFGEDGVAQGMKPGGTIFISATIHPSEIKELVDPAAEKGLQPLTRKESQDVCFIKDSNYKDFLIQADGIRPQAGDIVDTSGNRLGSHAGLHRYTVGQRRGINCPASQPYYVVRIDARCNRLVVGAKDELYASRCRVTDVNWIAGAPEGPIRVDTRIRYRHRAVAATVSPDGDDGAVVRFEEPQSAVTPGQGAVFYRGDEVIGGGWIM